MSKSAAARLFDLSLSSVKSYARKSTEEPLLNQQREAAGPRKVDQTTAKLLEGDVEKRPRAIVGKRRHFLERLTGRSLSDSTIRQVLKRLGLSQKTEHGGAGTGRVTESRLEGDGGAEEQPQQLVFVDEMGTNTSLSPLRAWSQRGERARCAVPRNRGKHHAAREHERRGDWSLLSYNRRGRRAGVRDLPEAGPTT
jgi:transposase